METVKRSIDPHNLMNPGKIYPHIRPVGGNHTFTGLQPTSKSAH